MLDSEKGRSANRSAQNRLRLIYGVTLRVNFTELVSAAPLRWSRSR